MGLLKLREHKTEQEIITPGEIESHIKALSGRPREARDAANWLIPLLVRNPELKEELKLFAEEKGQWTISRDIVRNLKPLRDTSNSEERYPGYRDKYYNGIKKASNTALDINEKRTMDRMELQERLRKALA